MTTEDFLETTKQATVIWYGHLEDFISEVFHKDANIADAEEPYNGTYKEVTVGPQDSLDLDEEEHLLAWLNDDESYIGVRQAITLLYSYGYLPEGNYIVTIWW
jgi:hypothetical protein